jgi:hypothetical protein
LHVDLKGIVSITGKPGLYRLVGQNKSAYIVESLSEQKQKLVLNPATARMASLEDITVYGEDEDIRLTAIFERIREAETAPPDTGKTDANSLRAYFREVAPQHDEDRVYTSDMKKIINWYHILVNSQLLQAAE